MPVGDGWLHEVKFDGYRVQIHKTGNDVTIYSRNGHVFTPRFETIAYLLRDLPAQSAVLDGEIVASDRRDVPNFARLHLRSGSADGLHLWCFDLLALNGRGWRHQPLEKRQDRLQGLIQRFDCPPVKASEPFTEGVKLLQVAERMKLESVVSKRRGTAYRLGQDDRLAHGEPRAWRMFERA